MPTLKYKDPATGLWLPVGQEGPKGLVGDIGPTGDKGPTGFNGANASGGAPGPNGNANPDSWKINWGSFKMGCQPGPASSPTISFSGWKTWHWTYTSWGLIINAAHGNFGARDAIQNIGISSQDGAGFEVAAANGSSKYIELWVHWMVWGSV